MLFLLLFGVVGVGRGEGKENVVLDGSVDLAYLYAAGECWLNVETPYNQNAYTKYIAQLFDTSSPGAFAYPPQIFPVCLILCIGTIQFAKMLFLLINLAALWGLAHLSFLIWNFTCRRPEKEKWYSAITSAPIAFALIVGNPFVSHVIWMGQTTLIAAVLGLGGWYAMLKGKEIAAGILFGLCTIKPQLVVLFLLWILLDRKWKVVAVAAITIVCCAAWPMYTSGPLRTWMEWIGSIFNYQMDWQADLTFRHVYGIRSLILQINWNCPSLAPVAFVLTTIMFLYRSRLYQDALPGAFLTVSASFIYAHDYDLAACAIIATPLIPRTRYRKYLTTIVLLCCFLLVFPLRIWSYFGIEWAARSREIALLVLTYILLVSAPRHSPKTSSSIERC